MKNKFSEVVLKKFQSYSFIIFIALIVGAFFALSQINNSNQDKPTKPDDDPVVNPNPGNDDDEPVVNLGDEEFQLPVASTNNPQKSRDFWSLDGSLEEQLKAIITYNDGSYKASEGVSYTIDNETEFNVLASLTGEVTNVKQDQVLGYIVEVEHLYGFTTIYRSLSNVTVAVGDTVDQGDVIGTSGTSNLDAESGVHVYFEVRRTGVDGALNPNELIGTKLKDYNND